MNKRTLKTIIICLFMASTYFSVEGFTDQKVEVKEVILKKIQEQGIQPGLALYHKLKNQKPRQYIFDQNPGNQPQYPRSL